MSVSRGSDGLQDLNLPEQEIHFGSARRSTERKIISRPDTMKDVSDFQLTMLD